MVAPGVAALALLVACAVAAYHARGAVTRALVLLIACAGLLLMPSALHPLDSLRPTPSAQVRAMVVRLAEAEASLGQTEREVRDAEREVRDAARAVGAAREVGARPPRAPRRAVQPAPQRAAPEAPQAASHAVAPAVEADASSRARSAAPVPPRRACAPGCERHGVCNAELGRCDCAPYMGGADCSQPLFSACAAAIGLREIAPAPCVIDGASRPNAPIACECLMQCESIGLMGQHRTPPAHADSPRTTGPRANAPRSAVQACANATRWTARTRRCASGRCASGRSGASQ